MVKLLLDSGADPAITDAQGRAAEIEARKKGYSKIVSLLRKEPGVQGGAEEPARVPGIASDQDVFILDRPVKIAQLTGEYDRERRMVTANRTLRRYKPIGTDLGVPFRHDGKTYLLFGDTVGAVGGDAIAYTKDENPDDGLDLTFLEEKPVCYQQIRIPGISREDFEAPVEGVSLDERMYVYHTTDHQRSTVMGRCVPAVSTDDGATFKRLYDLSSHYFINVSIVEAGGKDLPGTPFHDGDKFLVIFGADRRRKGDLRVAVQPASDIESGRSISFFSGLGVCCGPYQFEHFATGGDGRTTIYFTFSTWDPY